MVKVVNGGTLSLTIAGNPAFTSLKADGLTFDIPSNSDVATPEEVRQCHHAMLNLRREAIDQNEN